MPITSSFFRLMMKLAATIAAITLLFTGSAMAKTEDWLWDINSFETNIQIQQNGSIVVSEKIIADFTKEKHHGIVRYIPVKYRDSFGNKLNLRLSLISIKDEHGKDWNFEQSNEGENVVFKIGDPDTYLQDLAVFIITYKVDRALTYFNDHTELYWNATGTEWDVPMRNVKTIISLPSNPADKDLKATCFTGGYGSGAQNCAASIANGTITYEVTNPDQNATDLYPRQGLTVVAGFPVNLVNKPSSLQQTFWFLADNWGYFLPIFTFALMYYLWKTRGRDPVVSRTTIMPIYRPPNGLTPTEIGTIIDEEVDIIDINSAIIDLAVKGYITIKEIKEKTWIFESSDYEFEMIKDIQSDANLKPHEKKIASALFDSNQKIKLSMLKNKFYKDIPEIKNNVYQELVSKGYFPVNPEQVRSVYYTIGGVITCVAFFGIGGLLTVFGISVPLGLLASGIIILIFSSRMPAKTKKGVETFYLIKGLEEFINTAEKDRIKFQEKENIFETLLPYAMTLGLASKWSKAFQEIYKTPPKWYSSNDPNYLNHFNTLYLLDRLNSVNSNMQSTFTSSPRSASGGGSGFSGGFSGGGFGGGGGSAW